jgi:magnesium-transporting ATPase (P-type)
MRCITAQDHSDFGNPLPGAHPESAKAHSPTPYMLTRDAVAVDQTSNLTRGISQSKAARRLALYGPNALALAWVCVWLSIFLAQFRSLIVPC